MSTQYRLKQLIVIIGDSLSFMMGLWIALFIRRGTIPSSEEWLSHMEIFGIVFLGWLLIHYMIGLYELIRVAHRPALTQRIAKAFLAAFLIGTTFFYLVPSPLITPKTILFLSVMVGYALLYGWRLLFQKLWGSSRLVERILFVGYTQESKELLQHLSTPAHSGYEVIGLVDPLSKAPDLGDLPIYRDVHDIARLAEQAPVHSVIVAPNAKDNPIITSLLYTLLFSSVQVVDLSTFYERLMGRVPPGVFSEGWFLKNLTNTNKPIYTKWKKITDISAAITLSLVTLVLFPFIAIAIKLTSRGPILFSQKRIGIDGQEFIIYKFRSMKALAPDGSAEVNGAQFATKKDSRITSIGHILRKTRLDELPQVWNLLKGDVTLIGPRPERPSIVNKLTGMMPYYKLRHIVKPGLTGWAVIHQNYTDTMEKSLQKLQYDLYYIKHRSILLDIGIVLRTIQLLIQAKGQ